MMKKFFLIFLLISAFSLAQTVVSGKILDDNGHVQGQVLVLNFNTSQSVFSDSEGNFSIIADDKDELRFIKEGFYRNEFKIESKDFFATRQIILRPVETLIPEVKIQYQPTGNLEKDANNAGVSKKIAGLNSKMNEYMKSPMTEALPENATPKSFQPHNFSEGQVSLIGVAEAIAKLISVKTTKPDYYETRDFLARLKSEIDLSYYRKFGMGDEGIDRFLLYAEDVFLLSKKYRKKFDKVKISNELMSAFSEYKKTNNLEY
ncbi:hypothetical protein ASG31_00500 [Chryseobacterium sp. Leaf404]|uniref:hypothetical protein n=1 Tax=unclassified Chryseobacterium TaxID=2593645 RepID=UPI00070091CA|nr:MULTISPECIES: hypothetical protein [unclassified Chryseobacterium]KQT21860.1 hypothetical protein ASG31_00500 [Chryseobacterium sp. Leaf404]